jgi:hypothetical protein
MPNAQLRLHLPLSLSLAALGLAVGAVLPDPASAKVVRGSAKADRLVGTSHADVIEGGRGDDLINGLAGADRLYGERGNDLILGDGRDRISGGSGKDRIRIVAERIAFRVSCGPGRDRVEVRTARKTTVKQLRRRARGCETVKLVRLDASGQPLSGSPGATDGGTPGATSPGGSGTAAQPGAGVPAVPGATPPAPGPAPLPSPTPQPAPTPPPTVAPTRFVTTTGSDGGTCTAVAPCKTFARAYNVASDGEVVQVAAGSYPAQDVPGGTKAVTFRGLPGAKVFTLDSHASNITFDGVEVDTQFAKDSGFENHGGDNVTFKNARIGNVTDEKAALVDGTNMTFDNVVFHDAVLATNGVHMECVYAIVVPGMTVRNSIFHDCAIMDLFFTYGDWWSPLPPAYGGVTLENNVFVHPEDLQSGGWHYYGLFVGNTGPGGGSLTNWVVRNNTFENDANVSRTSSSGSRWVGNVGAVNCVAGVTYKKNVGDTCGGSGKVVSPASSSSTVTAPFGWNNPAAYDFTLKPGSPAIDAGDPADAPATDITGKARGLAPDAGAYER